MVGSRHNKLDEKQVDLEAKLVMNRRRIQEYDSFLIEKRMVEGLGAGRRC